jgi:3-dehydroquinate synthase
MEVFLQNKVMQLNIKSSQGAYKVKFIQDFKIALREECESKDIIIIDEKIYRLFKLDKFLMGKKIITIKANEKNKSFESLGKIINQVINFSFKKNDKIIVIGGGIIQDIGSFISSLIFRGVDWYFFPTSFLAQCDSCIGGKTSINFHGRKNQLGNFYPPKKIFIDTNFLQTLSKKDLRSGVGEMAHYFFVSSKSDFNYFKKNYLKALDKEMLVCKNLIYKSLHIKKFFIEVDEHDKKERLLLNYGHTFGHAIEALTNYKIPHGVAVANGMNISNFISYKKKLISLSQFEEMQEVLSKIFKNDKPSSINTKKYINFLRSDKKNINKNLRAVLTKGIGKMFLCEITIDKNFSQFLDSYENLYL